MKTEPNENEKVNRICLGWPWYDGPDRHTYQRYMEVCHYFGKMQERSEWLAWMRRNGHERNDMPPLDTMQADGDRAEITVDDGIFEFAYTDETGLSLVGQARERCVDNALQWGSEWIFFWDDDMIFPWSAFLRLWRHKKPAVAALAFTSREPILPVIFKWEISPRNGGERWHATNVIDYPENKLMSNEDVGGVLAFGTGVVLIHTSVFRQIPKPWFASTGCGEDVHFCLRCHEHGIPIYVDTSLKTMHKRFQPEWMDEIRYKKARAENPELYAKIASGEIR